MSSPVSTHVAPGSESPAVMAMRLSDPALDARDDFYPLTRGNRWTYDREFTIDRIVDGQSVDNFIYRARIDVEQTCIETLEGRGYQIERHRETSASGDEFLSWLRLRQDRDGLYEYDGVGRPECEPAIPTRRQRAAEGAIEISAALADKLPSGERDAVIAAIERQQERVTAIRAGLGMISAGVNRNEIQRLAYPLRRGAQWVLREDPRITERVEGIDPIRTPVGTLVGYRIALVWTNFFGPNDRVTLWYGRQGMLRLSVHLEETATDESGNIAGIMIFEERQTLTGLHLQDSRRFSQLQ